MPTRAFCCAPTVVHCVPLVDAVRTFRLAPGMAERMLFDRFIWPFVQSGCMCGNELSERTESANSKSVLAPHTGRI